MRAEVRAFYGLTQPLSRAGYYETDHHRQILKNVRGAILEGRIVALCGVIGSGKTVTLRRLQQQLKEENKITVSRSLAVDKHSIKLGTLIAALFYDLSPGKKVRVPLRTEDRERELQELMKKNKRPIALFIDDAHALKDEALTGLKRLMEVIEGDGGSLSVVLAGWPKLRNDLRRPKLEEIGMRTDTFSLDGITGSQREYIQWLFVGASRRRTGRELANFGFSGAKRRRTLVRASPLRGDFVVPHSRTRRPPLPEKLRRFSAGRRVRSGRDDAQLAPR